MHQECVSGFTLLKNFAKSTGTEARPEAVAGPSENCTPGSGQPACADSPRGTAELRNWLKGPLATRGSPLLSGLSSSEYGAGGVKWGKLVLMRRGPNDPKQEENRGRPEPAVIEKGNRARGWRRPVCGKRHVKYLGNGLRAVHVSNHQMARRRGIGNHRPVNGNTVLRDRRILGRVGYRILFPGAIRGRVQERLASLGP
jgi:hypothetical protein